MSLSLFLILMNNDMASQYNIVTEEQRRHTKHVKNTHITGNVQ